MTETECPFVPGARVAVESGHHSSGVYEDFVEKVHKSGNFTLRKNPKQQWRPVSPTNWTPAWNAFKTGESWRRDTLKIWDDTTDQEIKERLAAEDRRDRWRKVQSRIERFRYEHATEDLIASVEDALAAYDASQAKVAS